MSERSDDKTNPARRLERLAAERLALFGAAGANAGRTAVMQAKLVAIEREIDECYLAVREQRAVRDAARFTNEDRLLRGGVRPRITEPVTGSKR
jgi:hypothetical protein